MSVATLPFSPQSTTRSPFRRSLSVGCESSPFHDHLEDIQGNSGVPGRARRRSPREDTP